MSRPERGRVRRERVGEITSKSRPKKGRVRRERVGELEGLCKNREGLGRYEIHAKKGRVRSKRVGEVTILNKSLTASRPGVSWRVITINTSGLWRTKSWAKVLVLTKRVRCTLV